MLYSRAPIPYYQKEGQGPVYRETGIRAFSADFLQTYVNLPETPFEKIEAVDMMRLREHGHEVVGVVTDGVTLGVDHPEEVDRIERELLDNPLQRQLHAAIMGG
jgi:3-deoxy-manno-octulosonate cytidylyltransferase (CMP-KDO synthetase)